MKRYDPDITRVGAWVRPIMTPKSDGAWVSIVELEGLQRELREAREAIRRKVHSLECERENRLAEGGAR